MLNLEDMQSTMEDDVSMEAMLFDSLLAELSGVKNPSYHATNKTGTG